MSNMKILCSISTKNRYYSFLPLAILSVINQTRLPDKLVIFDDNDNPIDLKEKPVYQFLFNTLSLLNVDFEIIDGEKKGQHFNHQKANMMGYDWVWRIDDDTFPKSNVLENLCSYIQDGVGAIGGSILVPQWGIPEIKNEGSIDNLLRDINIQGGITDSVKEVEHLHCSFLYRAGICDYNLELSKVAHREETIFTYNIKNKGYRLLFVPNTITWHSHDLNGGKRSKEINEQEYLDDDLIFKKELERLKYV